MPNTIWNHGETYTSNSDWSGSKALSPNLMLHCHRKITVVLSLIPRIPSIHQRNKTSLVIVPYIKQWCYTCLDSSLINHLRKGPWNHFCWAGVPFMLQFLSCSILILAFKSLILGSELLFLCLDSHLLFPRSRANLLIFVGIL